MLWSKGLGNEQQAKTLGTLIESLKIVKFVSFKNGNDYEKWKTCTKTKIENVIVVNEFYPHMIYCFSHRYTY